MLIRDHAAPTQAPRDARLHYCESASHFANAQEALEDWASDPRSRIVGQGHCYIVGPAAVCPPEWVPITPHALCTYLQQDMDRIYER